MKDWLRAGLFTALATLTLFAAVVFVPHSEKPISTKGDAGSNEQAPAPVVFGAGITCPIPGSCIQGPIAADAIAPTRCEGGSVIGTGVDSGASGCEPPSPVPPVAYTVYVSGGGGNDSQTGNKGTAEHPFKTNTSAMAYASTFGSANALVQVRTDIGGPFDGGSQGYHESPQLPAYVVWTGANPSQATVVWSGLLTAPSLNTDAGPADYESYVDNLTFTGPSTITLGPNAQLNVKNSSFFGFVNQSGGKVVIDNSDPAGDIGTYTATANGAAPPIVNVQGNGLQTHTWTISGSGCAFWFAGNVIGSLTATNCTGSPAGFSTINVLDDVKETAGNITLLSSSTTISGGYFTGNMTTAGSNISCLNGCTVEGSFTAGHATDGGIDTHTVNFSSGHLIGSCTLNGGITLIAPIGFPICAQNGTGNSQVPAPATGVYVEGTQTINLAGGGTVTLTSSPQCNQGAIIANGDAGTGTSVISFNNCPIGATYHVQDNVGGTAFTMKFVKGTASCSSSTPHTTGNGDNVIVTILGTNAIACTPY